MKGEELCLLHSKLDALSSDEIVDVTMYSPNVGQLEHESIGKLNTMLH